MTHHPSGIDPVELTRSLIRCRSVTPADDGALDIVAACAAQLGFEVHRLDFDGTPNLYVRRGTSGPHLSFAGHTDVVPAGSDGWSAPPFDAVVREGEIIGRGASDMKGAIAAFLAAVSRTPVVELDRMTVSLIVTGDEEGVATDGTRRVLEWLDARDDLPDFCLVGEATNPHRLGEVVKVGRRGSLNATLKVTGTQGHVAYPESVDNPVHRIVSVLHDLTTVPLDEGSAHFEPSSLQVTSVDVGNPATNVVPQSATARFNVRFNDSHSGEGLEALLRARVERLGGTHDLSVTVSGEPFLTAESAHLRRLVEAVTSVTGLIPESNTSGGTSDARFISRYCDVAEFGLISATIHQVDERVRIDDLERLSDVYRELIRSWADA